MTTNGKTPTSWWQWWPLLIGWIGMLIAYQLDRSGPWSFYTKPSLERIAIGVTVIAVITSCFRLACTRQRTHLLLVAVAVTVMLREMHWDWTTKFVYVALAGLAFIAVVWRRDVFVFVHRQPLIRVWLVSTALTYVLSQAIARRVFRGLMPNEAEVYTVMEEMIEVVSHAMLIVTACVGPWSRKKSAGDDAFEIPIDGEQRSTSSN